MYFPLAKLELLRAESKEATDIPTSIVPALERWNQL